jgi:hypothetical protein
LEDEVGLIPCLEPGVHLDEVRVANADQDIGIIPQGLQGLGAGLGSRAGLEGLQGDLAGQEAILRQPNLAECPDPQELQDAEQMGERVGNCRGGLGLGAGSAPRLGHRDTRATRSRFVKDRPHQADRVGESPLIFSRVGSLTSAAPQFDLEGEQLAEESREEMPRCGGEFRLDAERPSRLPSRFESVTKSNDPTQIVR